MNWFQDDSVSSSISNLIDSTFGDGFLFVVLLVTVVHRRLFFSFSLTS